MQTVGTILFVGIDLCSRLPVLQAANYDVLQCECEPIAIVEALTQTRVDAVLFQCDPTPPSHLMVAATRAACGAPVVLFSHTASHYNEKDFDVVVPVLCSPSEWLPPIHEAIGLYRNLVTEAVQSSIYRCTQEGPQIQI